MDKLNSIEPNIDLSNLAFTYSKLAIDRTRCEICTKSAVKTPERRQWRRFGVFIVNFEHYFAPSSSVSTVNFEHIIAYSVGEMKSFYCFYKYAQKILHNA